MTHGLTNSRSSLKLYLLKDEKLVFLPFGGSFGGEKFSCADTSAVGLVAEDFADNVSYLQTPTIMVPPNSLSASDFSIRHAEMA
jgi:hypothetical protein